MGYHSYLYRDDELISVLDGEEEFLKELDELGIDYGLDPEGEYYYFYNNHYHYEVETACGMSLW